MTDAKANRPLPDPLHPDARHVKVATPSALKEGRSLTMFLDTGEAAVIIRHRSELKLVPWRRGVDAAQPFALVDTPADDSTTPIEPGKMFRKWGRVVALAEGPTNDRFLPTVKSEVSDGSRTRTTTYRGAGVKWSEGNSDLVVDLDTPRLAHGEATPVTRSQATQSSRVVGSYGDTMVTSLS